jgi:hypothetical protein
VRIRNEEDAKAAYLAYLRGEVPEDCHLAARRAVDLGFALEDDAGLWSVWVEPDDQDDFFTGQGMTILGPDGRVWKFSSNESVHERRIVEMALTHLYIEGVAHLVDPDALKEQVGVITSQRNHAVWALAEAGGRGELRRVPE